MKVLAILAVISSTALAGPPAILSVVNSVNSDARLSPGALVRLEYALPGDLDIRATSVQVAGRETLIRDEEDGRHIDVLLPLDVPPGPVAIVLTTSSGSSSPYSITLDPYAPALYAPTRSLFDPYAGGIGCNNPAMPGETLTLFATGLGATDNAGNTAKPVLLVSGKSAEVLESISTGFGAYRIRFAVPPGDGMRVVSVSIGGYSSNVVSFPTGKSLLSLQGARFQPGPAAPGAVMTAYQCGGLSFGPMGSVLAGALPNLPLSLGGLSIQVRDSTGVDRPALLYGAGRNQVNYIVPDATALGVATVTAFSGDQVLGISDIQVDRVAPNVFGFYQLEIVRLRGGVQLFEHGNVIDLNPDTDQVYLVMYGSGIRGLSSLAAVAARIGDVAIPVLYAGPQGHLPALDQVNVMLPRSLAGLGQTLLELTVDGKHTPVDLYFR
jgi:uncharacterized protein (TIGR03437 family)